MDTDKLRALAKKAVSMNDKPFSAVTDWVERLCSEKYAVEDYDGLIELIERCGIRLMKPAGAFLKLVKHQITTYRTDRSLPGDTYGNTHRQLRALTILKALVENCGTRFQTTFANERLVDRIKIMAGDPLTDETVKKKLYAVLLSWQHQFKDDRQMQLVAGLYAHLRGTRPGAAEAYRKEQEKLQEESKLRQKMRELDVREREVQREEEKRRLREEKERAKLKKPISATTRRPPFDFHKEKPAIMSAVGVGTQSAQSLVNALQHVNREKESVTDNAIVQDYLNKTKTARRQVVRYIQLVEDDTSGEFIGTLISTNETIIAALQLYDAYCKVPEHDSDDEAVGESAREADYNERSMANMELREVDKLQIRQRRAVERHASFQSIPRASTSAHEDLADLDFSSAALQAPLQPARADHEEFDRGNLSDYSDYDSSEDEASHTRRGAPPMSSYATADRGYERNGTGLLDADDDEGDPFADPDPDDGVGTPGITERPRMDWTSI